MDERHAHCLRLLMAGGPVLVRHPAQANHICTVVITPLQFEQSLISEEGW
jgi:hypothetical protein